ncbi:major facilitator superfamily transporter [Plectosphaerella plurivora]|uniref:Major facilitator superfamily transporter n=1 Tax=Plectosphaerella plurivora TaxID=936078 RepID=A0A9P8V516_9PEZI|nr:major facilitator superfamily transporter [Plectosphaerella plurivora]
MSSTDTEKAPPSPPAEITSPGAVSAETPVPEAAVEAEKPVPVFRPTREFLLAFLALSAIIILVALDATTLAVALPIMSSDLGGSALEAFWSGTSFLLASTVFQPTFASLSSIFGRKAMLLLCMTFFLAGSLMSALAQGFPLLIAGRTIKGIGGGGLIAVTEVVVVDLVPLAVRSLWFSIISAMWAVGTVAGPLIGAGFAQEASWRWIFWMNLPIIAIAATLVWFYLNQAAIPGDIAAKLQRFDWLGAVLFTASCVSLLFGITTGGVMNPWGSFRVILPLVLGAAGLAVFAYWEVRHAKEPMIDQGLFVNRSMIVSYFMTVLHGIVLWSLVYFLTLYYQAVKFYTPVMSAVAALPETLTIVPAGIVVGALSSITGHYRWALWIGWALTTIGSGLLCILNPDTPVRHWIPLNIPVGIGTGMLFPAMALAIQAACTPALNAQATAFYSFLRIFGQSVGIAVAGVIFQNAFRNELLQIPELSSLAEEYSRDATHVVRIINEMAEGPVKDALVGAYGDALRAIWYALVGFSGVGFLLSLLVQAYTLQQEHVTDQGLVQGDEKEKKKTEQKMEKASEELSGQK